MTSSTQVPKADIADLDQHRGHLLKFAMLQLRDRAAAEDLVQDTFVAAVATLDRFEGRSSLRTWLTRILLNKIVDHVRAAGRTVSIDAHGGEEAADSIEAFFQASGRYVEMPQAWHNPDEALTQSQFFEVLELCVSGLSRTAGQVFLLRELLGLSAEEICKELGISESNCSVLLHRSRIRLRACLERKWFTDPAKMLKRKGT
jgi:RNA polymerase sigma-70 factor (ECF subfamily)